ncbi:CbtA family protein [Geodermatophilus chilensis]|uniref:CbtA family protein n=1 Tax=Geodermatophilus chilensis TaxID=2035835 RepID=UPI000C26AC06|nr:CbtA family protein [Geodermatophilus chilensis]
MGFPTASAEVPDSTAPPFGALLAHIAAAGLVAGALSGTWSLLITERAIEPALAIEEARSATGGGDAEEMFSRTTQVLGGLLGAVLAGLVLSLVVAVVFAGIRHRLPARTDFGRMVLLGAIGFVVLGLLPALKIPANPPAVGEPGTVGTRTAIYGAVLASGVVVALLVSASVSVLRSRGVGIPMTTIAAVMVGAVLVALILVLFPHSPDTIPADVPAAVVWDFRLASLGQLAVMWATLGLVGGALVERLTRRSAPAAG